MLWGSFSGSSGVTALWRWEFCCWNTLWSISPSPEARWRGSLCMARKARCSLFGGGSLNLADVKCQPMTGYSTQIMIVVLLAADTRSSSPAHSDGASALVSRSFLPDPVKLAAGWSHLSLSHPPAGNPILGPELLGCQMKQGCFLQQNGLCKGRRQWWGLL